MRLSRKILVPTLIGFTLILAGLFFYSYFTNQADNNSRDQEDSQQAEEFFNSEIHSASDFALGLAIQAANDPAIQAAFAAHDRQKLMDLTLKSYQVLDKQFGVPQYQYHLPPAISFLRLHDPAKFGDDLSSFRGTVLQVNRTLQPVVGLEVGRGGLGVRGVVPVFYQGQHIGSVEFGTNVSDALLNKLKSEYGHDWRVLLTRESLSLATLEDINALKPGPTSDLLILATTGNTIFASPGTYAQVLANGERTISQAREARNQNYSITTLPLRDYSGKIIGVVDVVTDQSAAAQAQTARILFGILAAGAALAIGAFALVSATQRALTPLDDLTKAAATIASGDLTKEVTVNSDDEIGHLGVAFDKMRAQLRELIANLEQRVEERTKDLERRTRELEAASVVMRDIASEQSLDKLLADAVNLIREKFGFYHAGIFLVDDLKEYAVLRAATGEAGEQMLAQHHRLKIGEEGVVGNVAATGRPHVALSAGMDAAHFQSPLLPEIKSEMALPLIFGGRIIGALDVQSTSEAAFGQDNIKILQTLADQVAIAIENARLSERMRANLEELNTLHQEQTRTSWMSAAKSDATIFEYDGSTIMQGNYKLLPETIEQLRTGQPVILAGRGAGKRQKTSAREKHSTLLMPLMLRGELIGSLGIEKEEADYEWSQEELLMVENTANQAALALENARLIEETTRRAEVERVTSEISNKIGSSAQIETILRTTAEEISQALNGAEVLIQIQPDVAEKSELE